MTLTTDAGAVTATVSLAAPTMWMSLPVVSPPVPVACPPLVVALTPLARGVMLIAVDPQLVADGRVSDPPRPLRDLVADVRRSAWSVQVTSVEDRA